MTARTGKALGETVEGSCVEVEQPTLLWRLIFRTRRNSRSEETVIDQNFLKNPRFGEIKALLSQIAPLGEPPYRMSSTDDAEGVKEAKIETVDTLAALIDYVIGAGKRGYTVQRYKGLGEMNPEQLWETTMNPEKRTLLQVRIEDAVAANDIFTTLMGDQVEPRRDFIYQNALYASNLDV